tara:strand:+ start:600 stop:875 length:276 start_codon:yes stop_codon:yes gene_type:complete
MANSMASVAEHSLVKAATPFIVAALIGFSGWVFSSIMSLQQDVKLISEGTVHNLEEKVDGLSIKIDAMNLLLTDLRVLIGGVRDQRDRQDR